MSKTIRLSDIVDALEMQPDEYASFLDLDSGEIETVSHSLLGQAEESDGEEPELLDWQKHGWEIAKRIAASDRFVALPSKFDVNDWEIMNEFSQATESSRIRSELLDAIHGSGAFRNFKSAIRRHKIEQAWFDFRGEALKKIAIDWCEENQIVWE